MGENKIRLRSIVAFSTMTLALSRMLVLTVRASGSPNANT